MNGFYGECLRLEIFGQSHAESVGMTLEGVPAGARVDLDALLRFMQRRAPAGTPSSVMPTDSACDWPNISRRRHSP